MEKFKLPFNFKEAYEKVFARLACSIICAILTILLSFFSFLASGVVDWENYLTYIVITIAIMLIASSLFQIYYEFKKEDLFIYSEYLQKELENRNFIKERAMVLEMTVQAKELLETLRGFSALSKTTDFVQNLQTGKIGVRRTILNNFIKGTMFPKLKQFFGQVPNENFSIAVYLYDSQNRLLWDFMSKKDDSINPNEDSGRPWRLNSKSHVAFCYNHQTAIIHPNIQQSYAAFGFSMENNEGLKPEDEDNYKSAITLPLFFSRQAGRPIAGVLCITSDHEGTFYGETEEDGIVDSVYSLKILTIKMLTEIIADSIGIIYDNDISNIQQIPMI